MKPFCTIAFIGLGNMGSSMAANLVRAGLAVNGYDPSVAALDQASELGVRAFSSAAAVENSDAIIMMLPSGSIVLTVLAEIATSAKPGTLILDCSTIDIADARTAASTAKAHGFAMLDAPVSGGVGGAAAGTLTFMVGGSEEDYLRATDLLSIMGQRVVHCGASGLGQAAKICNNMVAAICMIGVSEAFLLSHSLGLSDEIFYAIASTSSAKCWALTTQCPVPGPVPDSAANRDFRPGFATELMLKDLRLGQAAADIASVPTPMGNLATRLYEDYAANGGAGKDFAGVIQWLSNLTRNGSSSVQEAARA